MRRLLTFALEEAEIGASLDDAGSRVGLLLVMGGSQSRVGSHRMYERLAYALSERGISCFRYDRRGVGDSSGTDQGFRDSAEDLVAAAGRFRIESPSLERLYGFGLCDGASALALFAGRARLDGVILVNPWLVEAASGEPPPAAIRRHYRQRILSADAWGRLLSGAIDFRKLLKGLKKVATNQSSALARDVAAALRAHRRPARFILASGDATAIAAQNEIRTPDYKGLTDDIATIESDSHTFARPGDEQSLAEAVWNSVQAFETGKAQSSAGT